jgi:hypothetical protein
MRISKADLQAMSKDGLVSFFTEVQTEFLEYNQGVLDAQITGVYMYMCVCVCVYVCVCLCIYVCVFVYIASMCMSSVDSVLIYVYLTLFITQ